MSIRRDSPDTDPKRRPLWRVCAWCDTDGKRTRKAHKLGYNVTHGICHPCSVKEWQAGEPEFYEYKEGPVEENNETKQEGNSTAAKS